MTFADCRDCRLKAIKNGASLRGELFLGQVGAVEANQPPESWCDKKDDANVGYVGQIVHVFLSKKFVSVKVATVTYPVTAEQGAEQPMPAFGSIRVCKDKVGTAVFNQEFWHVAGNW
jgi:hypothetical protein